MFAANRITAPTWPLRTDASSAGEALVPSIPTMIR